MNRRGFLGVLLASPVVAAPAASAAASLRGDLIVDGRVTARGISAAECAARAVADEKAMQEVAKLDAPTFAVKTDLNGYVSGLRRYRAENGSAEDDIKDA